MPNTTPNLSEENLNTISTQIDNLAAKTKNLPKNLIEAIANIQNEFKAGSPQDAEAQDLKDKIIAFFAYLNKSQRNEENEEEVKFLKNLIVDSEINEADIILTQTIPDYFILESINSDTQAYIYLFYRKVGELIGSKDELTKNLEILLKGKNKNLDSSSISFDNSMEAELGDLHLSIIEEHPFEFDFLHDFPELKLNTEPLELSDNQDSKDSIPSFLDSIDEDEDRSDLGLHFETHFDEALAEISVQVKNQAAKNQAAISTEKSPFKQAIKNILGFLHDESKSHQDLQAPITQFFSVIGQKDFKINDKEKAYLRNKILEMSQNHKDSLFPQEKINSILNSEDKKTQAYLYLFYEKISHLAYDYNDHGVNRYSLESILKLFRSPISVDYEDFNTFEINVVCLNNLLLSEFQAISEGKSSEYLKKSDKTLIEAIKDIQELFKNPSVDSSLADKKNRYSTLEEKIRVFFSIAPHDSANLNKKESKCLKTFFLSSESSAMLNFLESQKEDINKRSYLFLFMKKIARLTNNEEREDALHEILQRPESAQIRHYMDSLLTKTKVNGRKRAYSEVLLHSFGLNYQANKNADFSSSSFLSQEMKDDLLDSQESMMEQVVTQTNPFSIVQKEDDEKSNTPKIDNKNSDLSLDSKESSLKSSTLSENNSKDSQPSWEFFVEEDSTPKWQTIQPKELLKAEVSRLDLSVEVSSCDFSQKVSSPKLLELERPTTKAIAPYSFPAHIRNTPFSENKTFPTPSRASGEYFKDYNASISLRFNLSLSKKSPKIAFLMTALLFPLTAIGHFFELLIRPTLTLSQVGKEYSTLMTAPFKKTSPQQTQKSLTLFPPAPENKTNQAGNEADNANVSKEEASVYLRG